MPIVMMLIDWFMMALAEMMASPLWYWMTGRLTGGL